MPIINGMLVQSGGSKPHVVYIMEKLAKTFPNVIWKLGGKVERTTWGGGFSAHSEGRAIDIYLDAGDPLDKKLGDLLFLSFFLNNLYLKVDHTIWDGMIWSSATLFPTEYTGSGGAHRDHVHVAFKDDQLDVLPTGFDTIVKSVETFYNNGHDGAADRMDGLYGQAFNPKKPNVRLSRRARYKIMLKKMGMEGAGL